MHEQKILTRVNCHVSVSVVNVMKYRLEDLKIGMKVSKEELEEIKYVWMLVRYENESDTYGTLIHFSKDNPEDNYSYGIRVRLATYIADTGVDENGCYNEFWGIYINIDRHCSFEVLECYFKQVFSTLFIPEGQYRITVDTSFGKMTVEEEWQ